MVWEDGGGDPASYPIGRFAVSAVGKVYSRGVGELHIRAHKKVLGLHVSSIRFSRRPSTRAEISAHDS